MKQNKLLMILTAVFVILSGLLAGCTHDDVYDPNRGKNPLPDPNEIFGFGMREEINLYVNYDSPGIKALIEVYDENPLASENNEREKKEGVEALFKIYTDENGKFEGKMNIPAAVNTVYLYTGTWGLPGCLKLEVKDGSVRFDITHSQSSAPKAVTRAYHFPGKAPYLIDEKRNLYSLCKWGAFGDLTYDPATFEPIKDYITETSWVGEESVGDFVSRLQYFLVGGRPGSQVDNSAYVKGPETTNLHLSKEASVDVVFVNRDAAYNNTFGYYYYKGDNVDVKTVKKYIVFPNVSITPSYNEQFYRILKCGDKVRLKFFGEDGNAAASDKFPAGYTIGWFIYADGFDSSFFELADEIKENAPLITSNDVKQNYITLSDQKSGKLIIGVEDGGNKSYCDLLFYTEASPMEAVEDPNRPDIDPNVPTDKPDEIETVSGTLVFEDIWPSGGDYDMNDVVIEYARKVSFNKNNIVTKIEDCFTPVHDGALFKNAFAYQIDPNQWGKVSSADGVQTENVTSSIIVTDNVKIAQLKTFSITRDFGAGQGFNKKDLKEYNPYIIVKYIPGQPNRTEVHLPKHEATSMVDPELIGSKKDMYYVDREGKYPFAIDIPKLGFTVVTETQRIDSEYPDFIKWADSEGQKYKDWYNHYTGPHK